MTHRALFPYICDSSLPTLHLRKSTRSSSLLLFLYNQSHFINTILCLLGCFIKVWVGWESGKEWSTAAAEPETKGKALCLWCCGPSKKDQRGHLLLEAFAGTPSLGSPLIFKDKSHSLTHPTLWVRRQGLTALVVFILWMKWLSLLVQTKQAAYCCHRKCPDFLTAKARFVQC